MSSTETNLGNAIWKNVKCTNCGKTNIGWQANCLICGVKLSAAEPQSGTASKCPSCGAMVNKGLNFCTNCGNKLPEKLEVVQDVNPQVNVCANCGAELKPDAKFCTQCGTKV